MNNLKGEKKRQVFVDLKYKNYIFDLSKWKKYLKSFFVQKNVDASDELILEVCRFSVILLQSICLYMNGAFQFWKS